MRVLLVGNLDSGSPFGQFRRPFHLGRELAAAGYDVGVVGIDCSRIEFGPTWSTGRQAPRLLGATVRAAARRFAPDVIYAHQNMPSAVSITATVGRPVVADMHGVASVEWATLASAARGREAATHHLRRAQALVVERFIMRRARRIVAASAEVALRLSSRTSPREPIAVVVNGVEHELLDAPDPPPPRALTAPGWHALAVLPVAAWPANEQALDLLVRSCATAHARRADVHVHVVGTADGPAAPGLAYHGFVDELLPWLAHADACLLPYPPSAGGGGAARSKLLEYVARGRMVISTREGLRGLEMAAGWPGVVVAGDDPVAYGDALVDASSNGAGRLADARPTVRDELLWAPLAAAVADVLAGAAEG